MRRLRTWGLKSASVGAARPVGVAASAAVEQLEQRRLMAATFGLKVNFQPAGVDVPDGYVADVGHRYGDRGNGFTYGWNDDNTDDVRAHASPLTTDARHLTLNHLRAKSWWAAEVPNGRYQVRLVAGDARHVDSLYKVNVEGTVPIVDGVPTRERPWVEGVATVDVTDGSILLTNAAGAVNNKLAFVEITGVTGAVGAAGPAVVWFSDTEAAGSEPGTDRGEWRVSRSGGDLTQPLAVKYTLGGTATNGVDYQTLGGTLTIPAGARSVAFIVRPKDDGAVEGTETVTAKLALNGSAYTLGSVVAASCTIADNDTVAATPSVSWATAPSAPIGRVEPGVVQVGSKLYVMGGFVTGGSDMQVTRRVDVFDLATQKWSSAAQLPSGAAQTHGAVASDGKYIYLVAGQVGGNYNPATNRSYRYDIANNSWSQYVSLPSVRYGGALVHLNGKLYYFGGDQADRHTVSDDYWVLDTKAAAPSWKKLGDMPLSGDHLGHVVINGKIYLVGGEHGHAGVDKNPPPTYEQHDFLLEYNPATNAWTRKADMPIAASHFEGAIHVLGNKIVVFGGNDGWESQTNKIQVWDPATNKWKVILNPVPDARQGPASGVWNGRIYYTVGYSGALGITTKAYWGTLKNF